MICPFCYNNTKIYNSRSTQNGTQTWRRHRCTDCMKSFTTREKIDWTGRVQIQSNDGVTPYSRDRLLLSIARAAAELDLPAGAITDLTDSVEAELQRNFFFTPEVQQAASITALSTTVIARYDSNLALQYINQIYRSKPPKELVKALLDA